jgi:uncharacterized pyridoxamine 5'-phosphate oxidase family protein
MSEVLDFLKDAGVFYFATVDGDQPTVRPFGFYMEYEDKLYFGTSITRNVYHQIKTNPKFQAATCSKNMEWLRITGKAYFDSRPEVYAAAKVAHPQIFAQGENPDFIPTFFYAEDGEATFYTLTGGARTIRI